MNDQPNDETRTESNAEGIDSRNSLERETRTANPVDTFGASNLGFGPDHLEGDEPAEDVEIEVVLLSDDESEGDVPRTLTDNGSGPFPLYRLAPGVLMAGTAAALLFRYRSSRQTGGFRERLNRVGPVPSPLQGLSGTGSKGLGSIAGSQKARARALAAQAKAMAGKTPARKKKSPWEEARDTAQEVVNDNLATIIALTASVGLTIAARLIDVKREGNLPLPPPPPKKAWYQFGPWSQTFPRRKPGR
jgi:hypothetical protein